MTEVVHIAGPAITIGDQLRQRCCWCGAVLIDYDLSRVAALEGTDPRPGTWPPGDLVARDGAASWVVEHVDGERLPDGACGRLDHEVTA